MLRKITHTTALSLAFLGGGLALAQTHPQEYSNFKSSDRGEVSLSNGKRYSYMVTSRKTRGSIEILTARIEDPAWTGPKHDNLVITLDHQKKRVHGMADLSEGHYTLKGNGRNGASWVDPMTPAVLDSIHYEPSQPGSLATPAAAESEKDANGNYVIDVYLGFSDQAAANVGDIEATAHMYVESVNTGLRNSNVQGVYLRLVGVGQVSNNPGIVTSVLSDVKVWFKSDIDRLAPDLIGMVQMPTGAPNEAAGWAGVGGDTQVVGAPWPGAWRHEVGHNVGGWHCKESGDTGYNFGYKVRDGRTTIMCGNDLPYYSSPLIRDDEGNVLGSAEHQDMARVWRERMAEMASNRIHTVPYDGQNGTNLAKGRPVTVSSVENGSASLAGPLAVDGSTATRWSSTFNDPQWITVDLGQTCLINRVVLAWETAYGKDYELRVSDDNQTWKTLYSSNNGGRGGTESLAVSGSGRYVQMYGKARSTTWGYSLWEFEVYGTSTPMYGLKNRWLNTFLYDGGDQLKYGASMADNTYKWIVEDLGNGQKELRNAGTGHYIHIENIQDWAQCTPRTSGWWSSRWTLEDAGGGYSLFKNVWQAKNYLHVEGQKGYVQQGPIASKGWWSAQWQLVAAP